MAEDTKIKCSNRDSCGNKYLQTPHGRNKGMKSQAVVVPHASFCHCSWSVFLLQIDSCEAAMRP